MLKNQKKVLAVITARGGSKELPRKNILNLAGIPLIAWTIKAAKESKYITRVILSSDDDEIIQVAKKYDCDVPFRRPSKLATDEASSLDVIYHSIENVPGYDYVILLQPTSPLRTSEDIDSAFELMMSLEANSCVSVCKVKKTPYWMFNLGEDKSLKRLLPLPEGAQYRQALPDAYELNGAIYILKIESLYSHRGLVTEQSIAYVMERSVSIDIDSLADFKKCQNYLEESND